MGRKEKVRRYGNVERSRSRRVKSVDKREKEWGEQKENGRTVNRREEVERKRMREIGRGAED